MSRVSSFNPVRRFTYVTAHSATIPSLYLRQSSISNPSVEQSSFSNLSVTSPTTQLILQPFCCFTYIIAHSPTLLSLLQHHKLFTYGTWRAAHESRAPDNHTATDKTVRNTKDTTKSHERNPRPRRAGKRTRTDG